jgi:hypothetical protein
MTLQTTAVLGNGSVAVMSSPKHTRATIALQQSNSVLYAVCAQMLVAAVNELIGGKQPVIKQLLLCCSEWRGWLVSY